MQVFQDLTRIIFCFTMLFLAAFVQLPLLAYDFHAQAFSLYNYSLQFITCFILAFLFKKNYAAMAVIIYLVLGLIGLPIFAGGGGIRYFLEPSLGYLLALFILSVVTFRLKGSNFVVLALLLAHAIGLLYLLISKNLNLTSFFTYSFYQFIYDLILALILVIILPHEHNTKEASYTATDFKVKSRRANTSL